MKAAEFASTEAHIQGTHRMASAPEDGVVDRDLRTFECPNVLALGAGAFATCSPANPTLTLSALGLRAARRLVA
jgi:choline dehydrogenase-like flavoprotein